MPATGAPILLEEARCFICLGVSLSQALKLAALSRIALVADMGQVGTLIGNGLIAYDFFATSSTGWYAAQDSAGNITIQASGAHANFPASSVFCRVWPCASATDSTESGNLTDLFCESCGLTFLNVSNLIALTTLVCSHNFLTVLAVTSLTQLQTLICIDNQLGSLSVSGLTALADLECGNNPIPSLDLNGLPLLLNAFCLGMALNQAAVDAVLQALDANLGVNGNVDTTFNVPPGAAGLAAKASLILKGWSVSTD